MWRVGPSEPARLSAASLSTDALRLLPDFLGPDAGASSRAPTGPGKGPVSNLMIGGQRRQRCRPGQGPASMEALSDHGSWLHLRHLGEIFEAGNAGIKGRRGTVGRDSSKGCQVLLASLLRQAQFESWFFPWFWGGEGMRQRRKLAGPIGDVSPSWYYEAGGRTLSITALICFGSALLWLWFVEYAHPTRDLLVPPLSHDRCCLDRKTPSLDL